MSKKEWFESWFDSPFYHQLYKDRDDTEAALFLNNIIQFLAPHPEAHILDLACGKGRHSIFLANKGYQVTGVDLSAQSIAHAQAFAHEKLHFHQHDMRAPLVNQSFDYIFNLFTSFGYFENSQDNHKVLKSIYQALQKDGTLLIDFMNANKVIANLVKEETKVVDDISFDLQRSVQDQKIVKDIRFQYQEQDYHFQEKVQALQLEDFEELLQTNHFKIMHQFGDYQLNPYDPIHSDRLILIAQKA